MKFSYNWLSDLLDGAPADPLDDHDHGETAWRLRHLKRGVLKGVDTDIITAAPEHTPESTSGSLFGRAFASSARAAASGVAHWRSSTARTASAGTRTRLMGAIYATDSPCGRPGLRREFRRRGTGHTSGGLDGHGIYYYVPALLKHFTSADINALIAPRAHLAIAGKAHALVSGDRDLLALAGMTGLCSILAIDEFVRVHLQP